MRSVSFARLLAVAVTLSFAVATLAGERRADRDAVVPTRIPISGQLLAVTAEPRAGAVAMVVSIYAGQGDQEPLWSEEQLVTADASGRYSLELGLATEGGIPDAIFQTDEGRWIGVAVKGEPEQPRFLIVRVPYAARAADADTIGGKSSRDFVLASELKEKVYAALNEPPPDGTAPVLPGVAARGRSLQARSASPSPVVPNLSVTSAGHFIHDVLTGLTIGARGSAVSTADGTMTVGVTGVQGEINTTAAGVWSAAVRGVNLGTGSGARIGVLGYQAGAGYAVYGYTPGGTGVLGNGGNYGVYGAMADPDGIAAVYGVSSSGTATAVYGESYGTGVAVRALNHGGGTGLLVAGAIKVSGSGRPAFVHTASVGTIFENYTIIDHALCNGDPNAMLQVTPVYGDTSVYVNAPIGVWYNTGIGKWTIFTQNVTAMPVNAKFNVLVIKQ